MTGEIYNGFKYGSSMKNDVPFGAIEKKGSSEKVKDVVELAAKIEQQKILDQSLTNNERKIRAEKFLKIEFGVDGIQEIKNKRDKDDLDKLAKAIYLVGTYGSTEEVVDIIGFGVLDEIKSILPETFYGLEPEIRSNVITDDYLITQIKLIDKVRSEIKFIDYESIALYERKLMSVYDGLSDPSTINRLAVSKKDIKLKYGNDRNVAKLEVELLDSEYIGVQTYLTVHIQNVQEQMSILPRGEIKLPESKEEQLDLALSALLSLQSSGFKYSDLFVMEQSRILSAFVNPRAESPIQPDSEISSYVIATMKTIAQRTLLHQADGFMAYSGAEGATIEKALGQAGIDRNLYDRKDVDIIWGTDAWISKKLVVREFWDKLQEVNDGNGYVKMLHELVNDKLFLEVNKDFLLRWQMDLSNDDDKKQFLTKKIGLVAPDNRLYDELGTNMFSDSWMERKNLVEKYIKYKIGEDKKLNNVDISSIALESSWILAKDLTETTGIDALWNKALIGHRDDTELYYFYLSVKDYMEHFKNVGHYEEVAGQLILSAGRPWLHHAVNWDIGTQLKSVDIISGMKSGMYEKKQQDYWVSLEMAVGQWKQLILKPGYKPEEVLNDEFYSKFYDKCSKVGKLGAVLAIDDDSIDRYFQLFPPQKDKSDVKKYIDGYKSKFRNLAGVSELKGGKKCYADTFDRDVNGNLVLDEYGARKEDKVMVEMLGQRARELLIETIIADFKVRAEQYGWANKDILENVSKVRYFIGKERFIDDVDDGNVDKDVRKENLLSGKNTGYSYDSKKMRFLDLKRERKKIKRPFVQLEFVDKYAKAMGMDVEAERIMKEAIIKQGVANIKNKAGF
jgi:hypothetical protein